GKAALRCLPLYPVRTGLWRRRPTILCGPYAGGSIGGREGNRAGLSGHCRIARQFHVRLWPTRAPSVRYGPNRRHHPRSPVLLGPGGRAIACSTQPCLGSAGMNRPYLRFAKWSRLPLIRQAEAAECGLACLAMIAGWHGLDIDLTTLRRRFPISL